MAHSHRAVPAKAKDYGYSHPVTFPEKPAAHGNICRTDTCSCGAIRNSNINGRHREIGAWKESPADSDFAN